MVSVILPSVGRPMQLRKSVENIIATTEDVEIIAVVDDDAASAEAIKDLPVIVKTGGRLGSIAAWNYGASFSRGDIIVAAADDAAWYVDWLKNALRALGDGDGMVGFNDLAHDGYVLATHFLVTRKYAVEGWGGVLYCPHYKGFYCDNEAIERAKRDRKYIYAKDAIVEHRHWSHQKAVRDTTYTAKDQWWGHDLALYVKRKAANFPNDYPPSFGL